MKTILHLVLPSLAAYLIGSIPFGLLIASIKGVDIRTVGSGNIGATNVFRCVGKRWGMLTFAADLLKGLFCSTLLPHFTVFFDPAIRQDYIALAATIAVVAGHNWPVYLKFRGGKGIATSAGALAGLAWQALLIGAAAWAIIFLTSRYVSIASIISAIITASAAWILYSKTSMLLPIAMTLLAVWAIWRHHSNIERLIEGKEHRFEFRRKTSGSPAAKPSE